jgi:hypothetical protein
MRELKKHELDFDKTIDYFKQNLTSGNTLSEELINLNDFNLGSFFTLLPEEANIERVYKFDLAGILPQNPRMEYLVSEKKSFFSITPTIQDEVGNFILKISSENKRLSCVFEEMLKSPTSPWLDFFKKNNLLLTHQNEVYYILRRQSFKLDFIIKCLEAIGFAIWHSLFVLTEENLSDVVDDHLSLEKLKAICLSAKLIAIGAYDGEGYVFWERNMPNKK